MTACPAGYPVEVSPNLPGTVPTRDVYRGDPYADVYQFVDQDTTTWNPEGQVRMQADGPVVITTLSFDVAVGGNPELVRIRMDPANTALLPVGIVYWDMWVPEVPRTMLRGTFEVDPDVTR